MTIHRRRPAPSPRPPFPPEPQPAPPLTPRENLEEQLRRAVEHTGSTVDALRLVERRLSAISDVLGRQNTPARLTTIVLTADRPVHQDDVGEPSPSFGIYNPTPALIYVGVGGSIAQPGRRALSVPPNAGVVFPLMAHDLEIGADAADLAGGDAVLYLLRFHAVQSFFFRTFDAS